MKLEMDHRRVFRVVKKSLIQIFCICILITMSIGVYTLIFTGSEFDTNEPEDYNWEITFPTIQTYVDKSIFSRMCPSSAEIMEKSLIVTSDDIPISTIECTGSSVHSRRCIFTNAFVLNGTIWLISDGPKRRIPRILCSAVDDDVTETRMYCSIKCMNRSRMFDAIRSASTCVRTYDTGLVFGRLSPQNLYHSIFEDLIPAFEIMSTTSDLSSWTNYPFYDPSIKLNESSRLLFFQEDKGHDVSWKLWGRYFPHLHLLSLNDKIELQQPRFIRRLVAGSKASCAHYFHCSRASFITEGIALRLRQYIINATLTVEKERNKTHPVVLIIQRASSRVIANINEVAASFTDILGVNPEVLYYGAMTLDEQVKKTIAADIVVMVHGGAAGNALFMANDSLLIDIYPYNYPFHFHGLMNWVRQSLRPLRIHHAPFDVARSEDMLGLDLPPNCICSTSSRRDFYECGMLNCFHRVDRIIIDVKRFRSHLSTGLNKWISNTYQNPVTKIEFRGNNSIVPWYYHELGSDRVGGWKSLPNCFQTAQSSQVSGLFSTIWTYFL